MRASRVTLPKPGLIAPADPSTHPDMNVYTFINNTVKPVPYFKQCTIKAEKEMFIITHNVNTHKESIFHQEYNSICIHTNKFTNIFFR